MDDNELYEFYLEEFRQRLKGNPPNGDGFRQSMIDALQEVFWRGHVEAGG